MSGDVAAFIIYLVFCLSTPVCPHARMKVVSSFTFVCGRDWILQSLFVSSELLEK